MKLRPTKDSSSSLTAGETSQSCTYVILAKRSLPEVLGSLSGSQAGEGSARAFLAFLGHW